MLLCNIPDILPECIAKNVISKFPIPKGYTKIEGKNVDYQGDQRKTKNLKIAGIRGGHGEIDWKFSRGYLEIIDILNMGGRV